MNLLSMCEKMVHRGVFRVMKVVMGPLAQSGLETRVGPNLPAAINTAHGVQQEDEESPQRNELEAPLGELIVTGRRLMAPRTDGGGTLARPHGNLNALVVGSESSLMIDESPETVAAA